MSDELEYTINFIDKTFPATRLRLDELNVLLLTYFTLLVTLINQEIRMKSNNKDNKKVDQKKNFYQRRKTNVDRDGNAVNRRK